MIPDRICHHVGIRGIIWNPAEFTSPRVSRSKIKSYAEIEPQHTVGSTLDLRLDIIKSDNRGILALSRLHVKITMKRLICKQWKNNKSPTCLCNDINRSLLWVMFKPCGNIKNNQWNGLGIKASSGEICCHNARGRVRTGSLNPKPAGRRLDVLLTQAPMHCSNKHTTGRFNHDYSMAYLVSPHEYKNSTLKIGSCDRSRIHLPDLGGTDIWPGQIAFIRSVKTWIILLYIWIHL